MDFSLSEDHLMMRDFGRDFAQKRLAPIAEEMDAREELPQEIIKEAAELGFFGLQIPEQYGGQGVDTLSYALIMEELSRACAGFSIMISVHNSLVSKAIALYGTEEQRSEYLPKMAAGEIIGAYSLSEPGSGTDAGSLQTRAIADGANYVFNGTKSWVTGAGFAGLIVVFALTDPSKGPKGISAILVPPGTPGMSLGKPEKKMGLKCSDTREISFIDAKVPKKNLLGQEGQGYKIALSLLDNGRIGVGAQALGIAQLADMATRIDASRLLVYRAAVLKDQEGRFSKEISMAKLFATESANFVANQAVQIHGGYGYVKEYAVERYFRDARVTEIYEGTSEAQRMVIARDLLKG